MLLLVPGYALASDLGYMRISLIEGDIQVKTPEAGDWGPARLTDRSPKVIRYGYQKVAESNFS